MKTETTVTQIGMDIHKTFSRVTARDGRDKIAWRQRLDHRDRHALQERLRDWPTDVPVILEATFGWGWMSDDLQTAGLDPHLANAGKVAAWRKARGLAKSDRLDADLLSELWDQQPRWWEVWLAPPAVRQQREWMRYRMTLVHTQTELKNRIHAVLNRHGILHDHADLFGTQGRRLLSLLIAPKDATLPDSARATLKGYIQLLDHLRRQIAGVTREFRRQLVKSSAGNRLRTLPGISWILGYTIVAEIGQIERFPSARHLASYSLLVPRAWDSAVEVKDNDSDPKGRHIGRVGRRTLKWAWIEAAHGAVRSGGRFRKIFDRVTDGGKKNRNRGYITVAHELCRLGYVLWTKDVDYTEDPPERPGRKKKPACASHADRIDGSRSETGQPDVAMVAVSM